MIWFSIASIASFVIFAALAAASPYGWEDDDGWHEGIE